MMRPFLLALLVAAALLAPCESVQIRASSGPSKYSGGLVRDATYEASV
jgi:hypothetical protein